MRVYLIIHSFRKCTESLLEGTRPCARGVDAMGLGPVSSSYKELTQNEQYHMKEFQNCSKLRKRKQFLTKAKFSGQTRPRHGRWYSKGVPGRGDM